MAIGKGYNATITVSTECAENWRAAAKRLEQAGGQGGTLIIRPSCRWFMPTYVLKGAGFSSAQVCDDAFEYDVTGDKLEIEFTHRCARPIYWLWHRWVRAKAVIRRLLSKTD